MKLLLILILTLLSCTQYDYSLWEQVEGQIIEHEHIPETCIADECDPAIYETTVKIENAFMLNESKKYYEDHHQWQYVIVLKRSVHKIKNGHRVFLRNEYKFE
jgi:hypothetical protein